MNVWKREHRGQGFWLYELTLIISIIAVLVIVSFPIYSNILSRVREEVGGANARMLNAGITTLESFLPEKLPAVDEQDVTELGERHSSKATTQGTYNHCSEIHRHGLMDFLGLEQVKHVSWSVEDRRYISDPDSQGIGK